MARKIRSLILSDCILDKDIGLLKLVEFYYRNLDVFRDDILDHTVLEKQQYLEYTRTDKNPISVFIKPEYVDSADSLYSQFIDNESVRILELSCNTAIINMIKLIQLGDTPMEITIVCNTHYEADIIANRMNLHGFSNIRLLVEPDISKIDTNEYDEIYVKYIDQLDSFKKIQGKTIYISNHFLNLICYEDDPSLIVFKPNAIKYMVDNIVNMFSLYNFDEDLI